MLEREQVRAAAANLGLQWPDEADGCVADVLNACSVALTGAAARADRSVPTGLELGDWDRICVVLVDGLGMRNLEARIGHAPTLRSGIGDLPVLSAPYPSTTSASIGSFGTAASTGTTGMLGYTVRNPQDGRLGNLVQWAALPDPREWQREPTIFSTLTDRGITVTSVGPARFDGSGMTQASLHGARYVAAESWSDRIRRASQALREPGLVYLYWGDLDKAGHHYGWQSNQWCDELEKVDAGIRQLVAGVPQGTLVLLLADHGMIDVDLTKRWDVAQSPALSRDVSLIAGEPRALHVHLDGGADRQAAAARWRDELGESALVLELDEAVASGLFGAVADRNLVRIGDLVVAMADRATVVDSRTQTPASLTLIGVHGSLTPWEMDVPLLNWQR